MQLPCIVLLAVTTQCVIAQKNDYFSNVPLTSGAGIYFEDLGSLRLYRSHWKLVTHVNLKPLQGKEDSLLAYIQHIKRLCHTNSQTCDFEMDLASLESKMNRLRLNRETINDLIGKWNSPRSSRSKRGFFDFVGRASKFLFGTLDSGDEEYFRKQIDLVHQNSAQQRELFKQQISVLQSTIGDFSQVFQESSKKFQEIDSNMLVLSRAITELSGDLNRVKMNTMVHSHITQCGDMILEYEIGLEVLANAVLLGRRGLMHPKVLTPRELFAALVKYGANMVPGRGFPVPLELNYFATLIDLSEISLFFDDDQLVYVIAIPLTDAGQFRLFNVVPTPVRQADPDLYSFINPSQTYMGLSEDRKTYTLFTEVDFVQCKKYLNQYICGQSQPLYNVANTKSCESELLRSSGMVNIVKECDVRMARIQSTLWLQLKAPNTWIYVAPKKELLRIICAGNVDHKTELSSSGIIVLSKDCDGNSENVLLHSRSGEVVRTIGKDFIPAFTLNTSRVMRDIEVASRLNVSDLPLLNLGKVPHLNVENLRKSSAKLIEIYNQADIIGKQHRTETTYEQTISLATYIGYSIIALILIFVVVKLVTSMRKK